MLENEAGLDELEELENVVGFGRDGGLRAVNVERIKNVEVKLCRILFTAQ